MKKRLAVVLLGVVWTLVLLEVSLRLVGIFLHTQRANSRQRLPGDKQRVVLCVGDSFTEGLGAEDEESVPSRLEQLLNEQAGGLHTTVVNRGLAGLNSAQMLARLPGNLDRSKPDLVVLMTGANNSWNLWGHGLSFDHRRRSSAALDLLFRVRTIKLAVLLLRQLTEKRPSPQEEASNFRLLLGSSRPCIGYSAWFYPVASSGGAASRQHGALLGQISARLAANPGQGRLYCAKALVQVRMGALSEAVATLRRGLTADRGNSDLHYLLGTLHAGVIADMERGGPGRRRTLEAARRWHQKGMELEPKNGFNYYGVGELLALQTARGEDMDPAFNARMFKEARRWFAQGMSADPASAAAGRARATFLGNYVEGAADEYQWIRSDVDRMVRIIRARELRVVLHGYPNNGRNKRHIHRALSNANRAMADVARLHDLPFVDHHARFNEQAGEGEQARSLFSADIEHPNKQGYEIMARGVARSIELEGLLEPNK